MKNSQLNMGRLRTCDVAFPFVMPSGFAGDVNRGHPASIEAAQLDPNNPPFAFGQAVLASAAVPNTVRKVVTADLAITQIYGVTVRPYPFQAATAVNYGASSIGGGAPALAQPVDLLNEGYIIVPVVGNPIKGGAVFVWCAATGGGHTEGFFEAVATGGSTAALSTLKYRWNSPADANGLAELVIVL